MSGNKEEPAENGEFREAVDKAMQSMSLMLEKVESVLRKLDQAEKTLKERLRENPENTSM